MSRRSPTRELPPRHACRALGEDVQKAPHSISCFRILHNLVNLAACDDIPDLVWVTYDDLELVGVYSLCRVVMLLMIIIKPCDTSRDGNGAPIPDPRRGFNPLGDLNGSNLLPVGSLTGQI